MITQKGKYFFDEDGRYVMLRGFNLPAKTPVESASFYDGVFVSFVGAPWPLEVAEEHAQNLVKLGMNLVRLIVTWEAVMHAGPNEFDEDYLTYLGKLVTIFERYGIFVDIDPHQDVWSRYSGGDGAPKWTFDLAGLIPENFYETLAAVTERDYLLNKGEKLPHLFWFTNLNKLACKTMFTLFWAGDTYAPQLQVQNFLQEQYMLFIEKVVERVRGNKNILSVSTMNELSAGYIRNVHLEKICGRAKMELMPSSLQGFALADGKAMEVERYSFQRTGFHKKGKELVNQNNVRAWQKDCIWKLHGVWDYDGNGDPVVLQPKHFETPHGDTFANSFYKPFAKRFYQRVRKVREKTRILLETQEFIRPPNWDVEKDGSEVMFGRHFYDPAYTAFRWFQNVYNVYERVKIFAFSKFFIDRAFRIQFSNLKKMAQHYIGDVPYIVGETGFVMNPCKGVLGQNCNIINPKNYKEVEKAAQRTFQGIEANLINACLWNYNIHNTLENGDNWNSEDFSVYCSDLKDPIRGRKGWQRAYPQRTPGMPKKLKFSPKRRRFLYKFEADLSLKKPCKVVIPEYLLKKGKPQIITSEGEVEMRENVLYFTPKSRHAKIQINFR